MSDKKQTDGLDSLLDPDVKGIGSDEMAARVSELYQIAKKASTSGEPRFQLPMGPVTMDGGVQRAPTMLEQLQNMQIVNLRDGLKKAESERAVVEAKLATAVGLLESRPDYNHGYPREHAAWDRRRDEFLKDKDG